MSRSIWATLGIRQTGDRDTIRRAYAAKLRVTNPEDDPDAFMALRAAYETALKRAGNMRPVPVPVAVPVAVPVPPPPLPVADDPASTETDTAPAAEPPSPPPAWEPPPPPPPPESDPELEDLQARWRTLASAFDQSDPPDPDLLDDLLAAPALERIALRAEVEGELAALIANNQPQSDALVLPAIRALGWGDRPTSLRTSPALRRVLERAAELAPAPNTARGGFFNNFSQWRGSWRGWIWIGFVCLWLLRLVAGLAGDDKPADVRQRLILEAPATPEPTRRAPECPPEPPVTPGTERKPIACSPDAQWLSTNDFPQSLLTAAGTRDLTAKYTIGRDGYLTTCRLDPASGVAAVDGKVCALLTRRAHFVPGRDRNLRSLEWSGSFRWGWTVTTREVPAKTLRPLPGGEIKPQLPTSIELTSDCAALAAPDAAGETAGSSLGSNGKPGCGKRPEMLIH